MEHGAYRPEIDGLRGLAILMVLAYHASFTLGGMPVLEGGLAGVDVFFVISGYLITRIILQSLERKNFSFISFYERRARRLLPALFTVCGSSGIAAWLLLTPKGLLEFGQSLLATLFFGANIHFWGQDGYTAEASLHKPLLHMWSLGIEEQFYLLFPLFLLLAWRLFPRVLPWLLTALLLASLAGAVACTGTAPDTAFYLAPFRAWELLAGCLPALWEKDHGREARAGRNPAWPVLLGVLLILAFGVFCGRGTPHPSLPTLLPVAGTMLVIRFGGRDLVSKAFLASRAMVGLGLVSYSLYLWHQPVFVFARLHLGRSLHGPEKYGLFMVSLILAALTYLSVERPTRNRARTSPRAIWILAGTGTLALALYGGMIMLQDGFPGRFPQASAMLDQPLEAAPPKGVRTCREFDPHADPCLVQGVAEDGYTLVTLGDSHIRRLDGPITSHLDELESVSAFAPMNGSGQLFVLGPDAMRDMTNQQTCTEMAGYNQARLDAVLSLDTAMDRPLVITGGRLPAFLEHSGFDNRQGGADIGDYRPALAWRDENGDCVPLTMEEVGEAYVRTMAALLGAGVKVVLVYPIPEAGWHMGNLMIQLEREQGGNLERYLEESPFTTSRELFRERSRSACAVYDAIPDHPDLLRIYPEAIFCPDERCLTHDGTTLFYQDSHHLSHAGGELLLEAILQGIRDRWGERP